MAKRKITKSLHHANVFSVVFFSAVDNLYSVRADWPILEKPAGNTTRYA